MTVPAKTMKTRVKQSLQQMADEELIGLYLRAEAEAFEVIYERHAGATFSLAYRMCGSRVAAESISQEAFLAVWRSGGSYQASRGSVRSWILSVTRNKAVDFLRKRSLQEGRWAGDEMLADQVDSAVSTEAEVIRREQSHSVRVGIDGLSEEQRRVIELAYFGGFTHAEIADLEALPIGTVKGRMRLGLRKMNEELQRI